MSLKEAVKGIFLPLVMITFLAGVVFSNQPAGSQAADLVITGKYLQV